MSLKQILSDRKARGLSILMRGGSEIGVFKARRFLLVGVSLRGKELHDENEIFQVFQKHGAIVVEPFQKVRVKGKVRRAALLRFGRRAGFLAAISALQRSNKERRLAVQPVQPVLLWKSLS